MLDLHFLTKIRVYDARRNTTYNVVGFTIGGDDRAGLFIKTLDLYDPDTRERRTVLQGPEMKSISITQD